jgi:ATP-dependent exoDNAse (exonuclease V) alpha subunit
MNSGQAHVRSDDTFLLGTRELDLAHKWANTWESFSFEFLLSWLDSTKRGSVICPCPPERVQDASLSDMQRKAYNIVSNHFFGYQKHQQLLMIVVGTAGTGKSFLINAIRQLFAGHDSTGRLRVTTPTGIAALNIKGSTIYSLLFLLLENLNGERLHQLQTTMAGVLLLIVNEYSFLSAATLATIDWRLREAFPHKSNIPFGGINILLCGDPAQLPPVRAQPIYAHGVATAHLAARFQLFTKVVELDQPFRQSGVDPTQTRFRQLLSRLANCEATESDWQWLQTRRSVNLSASENALFDDSKFIVLTDDARNVLNRHKLAMFSPVMKVDECEEDPDSYNKEYADGKRCDSNDLQLFAVGADVMLMMNLWTKAGLVNGACGRVVDILKPDDFRKTRILMVDFPTYRGPALLPSRPSIVPITQVPGRKFKGVPLTLAWAITIHKSQGLSLERATIDLGDKEFSSGLTFVALSRVKSFTGLRIVPFDYDRYNRVTLGRHVSARRAEFVRLRALAAVTDV